MTDSPYWMALAHLPGWQTEKLNYLVFEILDKKKLSLSEFFDLNAGELQNEFELSYPEASDIENIKSEVPNYSFIAESLIEQGFELVPINSRNYPESFRRNLGLKYSPPLLYTKGNKNLLRESIVAIVGSRNASENSLRFTRTISQNCARNSQVVVSGFAKGVDKTALEETLNVNGRSIIVLPQGITTFDKGYKDYYRQIVEGDILVLSTFHPNAPWNVGLAMIRNVYIYGLADKIFVAESDSKGGTWSGVIDGLRKGRKIFVRKPAPEERNANDLLISRGGIPVDMNGKTHYEDIIRNLKPLLANLLSAQALSTQQIKDYFQLDIDTKDLTKILLKSDFLIKEKTKSQVKFRLKSAEPQQYSLFKQI